MDRTHGRVSWRQRPPATESMQERADLRHSLLDSCAEEATTHRPSRCTYRGHESRGKVSLFTYPFANRGGNCSLVTSSSRYWLAMHRLSLLMCLLSLSLSLPYFSFVDCVVRHPHRSAASQTTSSVLVGSHHPPRLASPSTYTLQPRARRGYHSFLSFGSGWNLYYTSWAGSLLPIQ